MALKKKQPTTNIGLSSLHLKMSKMHDHLEPTRPILLDDDPQYEFHSYNAESKVFLVIDASMKWSFYISRTMIDQLLHLQRYFDAMCQKHHCHAVTTCEQRARVHHLKQAKQKKS